MSGLVPSRLHVHGVGVAFGGVQALEDVDLRLERGEVLGVIGPNGAGKTTLLNAISGFLPRRRGRVELDGVDVTGWRADRIASAGVGRSYQEPHMLEDESVLENVMAGGFATTTRGAVAHVLHWRWSGRHERELAARAREVLEVLDLSEVTAARVADLPYGIRKLVDIARALVSRPKLVLLDEPTSGLDGEEQAAMGDALAVVRAKADISVLMVEHHLDLVRARCDRVVALHAGAVLVTGTPEEVFTSEVLQAALTGAAPAPPATTGDVA